MDNGDGPWALLMQISSYVLYGIVETIVFLVVICFFLLIFIRRNNTKIRGLQGNLQKLLSAHQRLHQTLEHERLEHTTSNSYKKQINEQLLLTKEYHKGLNSGQDISLDLNPESPKNCQTAAIRHALLVAEKEALNSSTDGTPSWQFLETKFQQLIQFYVDLSGKKKSPEKTPSAAQSDPEFSQPLHREPALPAIQIEELGTLDKDGVEYSQTAELTDDNKQSSKELEKLRNLTSDQHRLISRLQQQLEAATSIEEKQALIKQLQSELSRQVGFVTESESCIQLLENELTTATTQLRTIEGELSQAREELAQIPKMQAIIQQFSLESKQMVASLSELERINELLQAGQTETQPGPDNNELIRTMQQQLQNLQGQHVELEKTQRHLEESGADMNRVNLG